MKRHLAILASTLLILLTACTDPCKAGHTWQEATCTTPQTCSVCGTTEGTVSDHKWIYSAESSEKHCSKCGENENFTPSGYFLSSFQIEMDSFKPYFNDEHILCAVDEKTYEKFNSSKEATLVKSLLDEGKVFYVETNATCDILPDTKMSAPQRHIVVTSGKYNGTECWTAMAVVVDQSDIDLYDQWLGDPQNPANRSDTDSSSSQSNTSTDSSSNYVGILPGTYLVGTDIPEGTYRLVPLYSEYPGYWKRTSNASGEADSIIANDLFEATTYVTVKKGEYLQISRCTGALQ